MESVSGSALLVLLFQMNMTLSLNLKPLLWITPFFTRHSSAPQLITKIHLQRELELSLRGLEPPVYQFVHTGMNPAVVLPQIKPLAFAALGIVGSSMCAGIKEGRTSKGMGCSSKLCGAKGCEVRGSLCCLLEVLWWLILSRFSAGSVLPPAMPTPEHLTVCVLMICASSLETAIHVEPQDIHLLLSFCALKGYYFESHFLQQPLQRVTLSSSANRAERCTWFNIKQGYVFN